MTKTCSTCRETRPLDEFYESPTHADGRHGVCKLCQRARAAELRAARAAAPVDPVTEKVCSTCREAKPGHEFSRDGRRGSGLRSECKPCAQRRKWLERYGLTHEQYEERRRAQGGLCAICSRPPADGDRLHVDHCHASTVVRGLLCGSCNRGLGLFGDQPGRLEKAAAYLRGSGGAF